MRRRSGSGICFVPALISCCIVRLTCGTAARVWVYALNASNHSGSRARARSLSSSANRSKRSALRSVGLSAKRIAMTLSRSGMR